MDSRSAQRSRRGNEPFSRPRALKDMASARLWMAMALMAAQPLVGSLHAAEAGFALTPAENQRVIARQIVIRASLDSSERRGTVRAAVRIEAPAQAVFQMML